MSATFFVEFKIRKQIRLRKRHGIYEKKPNNLHNNSLFSKKDIINSFSF